tara:strand:+ start:2497 stop:2775 length:279 start_codon:yes stop_codon:yes gene_type:complete
MDLEKTWDIVLALRANVTSSKIDRTIRRVSNQSNNAQLKIDALFVPDHIDAVKQAIVDTQTQSHRKLSERAAYEKILKEVLLAYRSMMKKSK